MTELGFKMTQANIFNEKKFYEIFMTGYCMNLVFSGSATIQILFFAN